MLKISAQIFILTLAFFLGLQFSAAPVLAADLNPNQSHDPGQDHGPDHKYSEIDLKKIEEQLKNDGVIGWIHGAVEDRQIFVFTYRNPTDFFDYVNFPVATDDPSVASKLASLNRHDQVKITGGYIDNDAPIPHIAITGVEVVKAHHSVVTESFYEYKTKIDEVLNKDEAIVRVHALGADGQMLVVEYKDLVIPLFVKSADDQAKVQELYRGDKILIRYKAQRTPHSPTHLNLKSASALAGKPSFEIVSSILKIHNQPLDKTGSLIFFQKSPEITRNIFALQEVDPDGAPIQYTLVNFENPELFLQILDKLQKAWDSQIKTAVNARNKMINPKIQVHVKGMGNMVSRSQANPQILIDHIDALEIQILP